MVFLGPNGDCPSGSFTDLDPNLTYCYHIQYNAGLNWDESSRACKALGHNAELASIHSEDEVHAIANEIQKQDTNVWIGLFTTPPAEGYNATYHWTDNSPVDLIYWNEGEPNGANNFEHCTEMIAQNGKWNDVSCTPYYSHGYVCKAAKSKTIFFALINIICHFFLYSYFSPSHSSPNSPFTSDQLNKDHF